MIALGVLARVASSIAAQDGPGLVVGEGSPGPGGTVTFPIFLKSTEAVEGVSAIIELDPGAGTSAGIGIAPSLDAADTLVSRIEDSYIAVVAVMDTDGSGQSAIPPGTRTHLFDAAIRCSRSPVAIRFVDLKHSMTDGGPLLENLVVVDGIDIARTEGLVLEGGSVTCDISGDGLRVPGDCNADARLDISDGVCVLGILFLGQPAAFPCGDGSPADPGNVSLIDWQPDGIIDISDATSLLRFLFLGSRAHPAAIPGSEVSACAPIPGCDAEVCP
jgi:hypothetical protein